MRLPSGELTGSLSIEDFEKLDRRDLMIIASSGNYRLFVFGGRLVNNGLGEGRATSFARKLLLRMK